MSSFAERLVIDQNGWPMLLKEPPKDGKVRVDLSAAALPSAPKPRPKREHTSSLGLPYEPVVSYSEAASMLDIDPVSLRELLDLSDVGKQLAVKRADIERLAERLPEWERRGLVKRTGKP